MWFYSFCESLCGYISHQKKRIIVNFIANFASFVQRESSTVCERIMARMTDKKMVEIERMIEEAEEIDFSQPRWSQMVLAKHVVEAGRLRLNEGKQYYFPGYCRFPYNEFLKKYVILNRFLKKCFSRSDNFHLCVCWFLFPCSIVVLQRIVSATKCPIGISFHSSLAIMMHDGNCGAWQREWVLITICATSTIVMWRSWSLHCTCQMELNFYCHFNEDISEFQVY